MAVRRAHIRRLVDDLLAKQSPQKPPVRLERIAKLHEIRIARVQAEEGLSGFLLRRPSPEGPVIGVNQSENDARQRFTIAHELGHFFLHEGRGRTELHVDRTATVFHRNVRSAAGQDEMEIEANLFAAELLMPHQWVKQDANTAGFWDLGDETRIKSLARRYGVSSHAMTIRLVNLGYITI